MKKLLFGCEVLSVICLTDAFAMKISSDDIQMLGSAKASPIKTVFRTDIDMTKLNDSSFNLKLNDIPEKLKPYHFDRIIPTLGEGTPEPDFQTICNLEYLINTLSFDLKQIFPCKASDFIEHLSQNCSQMKPNIFELPDDDFLYYKTVEDGRPHIFLHLSSKNISNVSDFNQKLEGRSVCAYDSDVVMKSKNSIDLDHVDLYSRNINLASDNRLKIHSSKLQAKEAINEDAKILLNEGEVTKGRLYASGGYQEYVKEINPSILKADRVIQRGNNVTNRGILVQSKEYYDLGGHTSNVPLETTIFGHMEKSKSNLFGTSRTTVDTKDDVLIPNEFHVDWYVSENSELGNTLYNEMTRIFAEKGIVINKDLNLAGVSKENHFRKVETSSSGFLAAWLGPKTPNIANEISQLQKRIRDIRGPMDLYAIEKEVVSKIKRLKKFTKHLSELKKCLVNFNASPLASTKAFLEILAKYVGPEVFIGKQTITTIQNDTTGHGNYFEAPILEFNNKKTEIAGDVYANDIFINTGSLVTLALPQTSEITQESESIGVSFDLLTFATYLMDPTVSGIMKAALSASTINVGFKEAQSKRGSYVPSKILAKNQIKINAREGHLTHTQIKAGLVYAIFTGDLVMETLANENWSQQSSANFSASFGVKKDSDKKEKETEGKKNQEESQQPESKDFSSFAENLKNMVSSSTLSTRESEAFEKYIDDYAYMIGEKEFYLKVGGLLKTKSVLFGNQLGDQSREYISAGKIQYEKIKEGRHSTSFEHTVSVADVTAACDALVEFSDTLKETVNNLEKIDGEDIKQAISGVLQDGENKVKEIFSGVECPKREETSTEKFVENASTLGKMWNVIWKPFKGLEG